jgi:hypothetical protein
MDRQVIKVSAIAKKKLTLLFYSDAPTDNDNIIYDRLL